MESRMMNYGMRIYDPALGRFLSVDPLWQSFRSLSPYQYAYNSPLSYKDPTGLAPQKEQGEKVLAPLKDPRIPDKYAQVVGLNNFTMSDRQMELAIRDYNNRKTSYAWMTAFPREYQAYLDLVKSRLGSNESDDWRGSSGEKPDLSSAVKLSEEKVKKLNELISKVPQLKYFIDTFERIASLDGKKREYFEYEGTTDYALVDSEDSKQYNIYISNSFFENPEWKQVYLIAHENYHFYEWMFGLLTDEIYDTKEFTDDKGEKFSYSLLKDELEALQFGNSMLYDYYKHNSIDSPILFMYYYRIDDVNQFNIPETLWFHNDYTKPTFKGKK